MIFWGVWADFNNNEHYQMFIFFRDRLKYAKIIFKFLKKSSKVSPLRVRAGFQGARDFRKKSTQKLAYSSHHL